VLDWVEIVSAEGAAKRGPDQLGFAYRRSALTAGEIVSRVRFALAPGAPDAIRATIASMRERRHAAQPKGIRTFGSTFKNPPGHTAGRLLADSGAAQLAVGGARFSRKHANFVENTGGATTADILELMALGRERVSARFGIELEPEVELLGEARFPW
jgi:UDP-N-acetylmuramate dehydrogenase